MNNKAANSQIDIDQFSTGVNNLFNKIENPSIINIVGTPAQELQKRTMLLGEMVDNLNRPILKGMADDMISVMVSWLNDPEVLCCLIQGIWAAYAAKNININASIKLSDSDFGKFLDHLITALDFIIIFLTQDIRRITFFIPDFVKEIMNAIMGAILLLLQETCFALRNSIISIIFKWMDSWDTEKTWSKCLPLKQMINIFKKYFHDHGMLADLLEKIKGYTAGLRTKFEFLANITVPNIKDLEFLYWLRDLFVRLKMASLNFDLCVDYEFIPSTENTDSKISEITKTSKYITDVSSPESSQRNLSDFQGYTIAGDGSLIIDREKSSNGNWLPKLSNGFLRDFIHKEYNIPYDIIDNTITRTTSADNIQGSNITSDYENILVDKCANTPTSKEILKWILDIKNR